MYVKGKTNDNIVYKNTKSKIKGMSNGFTIIDNKKYNYSLIMDKIIVVKELLDRNTGQMQGDKSNKFIVLEKNLFLNSTTNYDEVSSIIASNFPVFLLDGNPIIDFIHMGIKRVQLSGRYTPEFTQDMENIISIIHDFNGEDYEEFNEIVLLNKTSKYDSRTIEMIKNILFNMHKNNHIFKTINPNIHEYILALKVAFQMIDIGGVNLDDRLEKANLPIEELPQKNLKVKDSDTTNSVNNKEQVHDTKKELEEDVNFVNKLFSQNGVKKEHSEEFLNSAMYDNLVDVPIIEVDLKETIGDMDEYYSIINELNIDNVINDGNNIQNEQEEHITEEKTIKDIKPEFQKIQIDQNDLRTTVRGNVELNPSLADEVIIKNLKDAGLNDTEVIAKAPSENIIEDSPDIELFPENEVLEEPSIEEVFITPDEIHSNTLTAKEAFREKEENTEDKKECLQSRGEELGDTEGNSVEKEEEIHEKNNEEDLVEKQDPGSFFSQPAPEIN